MRSFELTDREILRIAAEQSAIDMNCRAEDFFKTENLVTISAADPRARKYIELPFDCNLVYYGHNIVASVRDCNIADTVRRYISSYPAEHCFETPNMHVLDDGLRRYGLKVCHMAEYFLPTSDGMKYLKCPYETRILTPERFGNLYGKEWGNALCEKRKELDMLAVGAFDGERLVGLAGCSADCGDMWQIGVDVLPEYRMKGIAGAITSELAQRVLETGKIPFYCAAWSNIRSVRNALKCGFKPAWVEMTAKSAAFVDLLNK